MAFKDLFRPKWKHSDPFIRRKAVEKITDQKILVEIADANARDYYICLHAVSKLTEQKTLINIATNSRFLEVRIKAIEKIIDQDFLINMLTKDNFPELDRIGVSTILLSDLELIRLAAIKNLTDQKTLTDLALNDEDSEIRRDAIKNIMDQEILIEILNNEKEQYNRIQAVEQLADPSILLNILQNDKDLKVRSRARDHYEARIFEICKENKQTKYNAEILVNTLDYSDKHIRSSTSIALINYAKHSPELLLDFWNRIYDKSETHRDIAAEKNPRHEDYASSDCHYDSEPVWLTSHKDMMVEGVFPKNPPKL